MSWDIYLTHNSYHGIYAFDLLFEVRLLVVNFLRLVNALYQSLVVTWLILPVVICLSQRLSHACLSISNLYSETANGSLIQLWSTRHQIYHLDNRGNSIANTCERNGDFGSHAVIRYKPTWGKTQSWWLIVTCRSNCVDSTFDFLPYHGSVYGSGVHWQ